MTTEKILNIIRDKYGLKKVEFGCEVKVKWGNNKYQGKVWRNYLSGELDIIDDYGGGVVSVNPKNPKAPQVSEIIGLSVELNHLLCVLGEEIEITPCSKEGTPQLEIHFPFVKTLYYDLTESVEENLDKNRELRKEISKYLI